MRPTVFSFQLFGLDFNFHAYTIALSVAFLVGVLCSVRENYRTARPYPVTPLGGLWVFFPAILGSKIYYYLQYEPKNVWRAVFLWEGGLVFYGGLIGGVLGAVLYLRWNKVPLLPMGDIAMPFVPLAHAIARLGCFLNGCCWGGHTDLPWGVTFPRNSMVYHKQLTDGLIKGGAAAPLPVHPVQLYESIGLLCIFFLMRALYKRPHRTGALLFMYPMLYGVLRFCTETFRGDVPRGLLHFTASQWVAIGLAVFGALGWIWVQTRRVPDDTVEAGEAPMAPNAEAPAQD